MSEPRPYQEWRIDPFYRWRDAFHTFGHLMMTHARDEALENLPVDASDETRALASKIAESALYNVMMIFEGVVGAPADDDHMLEFVLAARVRKCEKPHPVVEQFELAPDGEESVCMGFHFWTEGDFQT